MSLSRLATGFAATLFATAVSVDPRVHAPAPIPPRPIIAREATPRVEAATDTIGHADGPAPRDVEVEITPEPRGGHRVVVRRRGYLVSLRHQDARAAGEDWAAMHLATRSGQRDGVRDRLIWEATRPGTLETTRGIVKLTATGGALAAELQQADPIRAAGAWKSAVATCAAQHDGLGGFTVLCRFPKGVLHVGAANVTGARSLDDVWVTSGPSPMVRLDLPYQPDGAEGRVIGFSHGLRSVALRAEASFPDGEAATLMIDEAQRAQPEAPR